MEKKMKSPYTAAITGCALQSPFASEFPKSATKIYHRI